MTKTALYLRVSTLEQAETGYSLGMQEERLKAYCASKGWIVHKVYKDDGYSGANLNRPAMQDMIREINNFDAILVYRLDRLSRSQKDTLYLIEDIFLKNDKNFVSLNESFDTSSAFGRAMIGILSVFAQLERENIRERLHMGRIGRAKDGYYHGGGNFDPLGYSYIDGELVVNEKERQIIEDIFTTYAAGNSMAETAIRMRDKYPERIRSQTIVREALKNNLYIGKVTFAGETYEGRHEPLIDKKLFDQVQGIRKKRYSSAGRTNKRKGLLLGKIYCHHCGARYYREVSGPRKYRYKYYKCYSRSRKRSTEAMIKDPDCKNEIWREEDLDELVLDKLRNFDFSKYEIKERDNGSKIKNKENQLIEIDRQLSKLRDVYLMDLVTKDELKEKSKHLKSRKEIIEKEMSEINAEQNPKETIQTLQNFDWEKSDKEKKMQLIDTVIDSIEVDNDKVYVHLVF